MLCKKCGRREATQQDGLCDHYRFMKRLDVAIREKREEDATGSSGFKGSVSD